MSAAATLSFEDVAAALRVDGSGLVWRVKRGSAVEGAPAGRRHHLGYIVLKFAGHSLMAHRVVWLLTHGEWPAGQLDHINGVRDDNSPGNLRLADNAKNQCNTKSRGAVPFKGVTVHTQTGRFQAVCGKTYLGLFDDAKSAALAYDTEAARRYGEFARLNFKEN